MRCCKCDELREEFSGNIPDIRKTTKKTLCKLPEGSKSVSREKSFCMKRGEDGSFDGQTHEDSYIGSNITTVTRMHR